MLFPSEFSVQSRLAVPFHVDCRYEELIVWCTPLHKGQGLRTNGRDRKFRLLPSLVSRPNLLPVPPHRRATESARRCFASAPPHPNRANGVSGLFRGCPEGYLPLARSLFGFRFSLLRKEREMERRTAHRHGGRSLPTRVGALSPREWALRSPSPHGGWRDSSRSQRREAPQYGLGKSLYLPPAR